MDLRDPRGSTNYSRVNRISEVIKFFDCGIVHLRSNLATPRCDFIVQDVSSLLDKIIPHFDLYPLLNLKQKDYICFKVYVND